ncbi:MULTISPECIES: hypothetical protein [unclassified Streptomyces]|uniref:hypothetical protein n=1 Tax=unclassified Streptomyces TaxID=2593676 RepID=UPI002E27EDCA|nr:hypothetical protein [Streptomyces sp. NBC_00223]
MKPQVNIAAVVDVIGALSESTLLNGNLCLIDDSAYDSTGQGTPELCTVVRPGQVVQWSAIALDVQTPVEIKSITFLGADGSPAGEITPSSESAELGRDVWSGVVPAYMPRGVPQRYRVEFQMYEGAASVAHIDSASLTCL